MSADPMSFAEAMAYSAGTIALTFLFGCGIVGQRIALHNKPVLLRRTGRSGFTRTPFNARDGGGEGGPATTCVALPEAGESGAEIIDWEAFHDATDRARMACRSSGKIGKISSKNLQPIDVIGCSVAAPSGGEARAC